MDLMKYLHTDEELKQFRQEWKEKFTESFPVYNYDEYNGIDDYKRHIKEALETEDYQKSIGIVASKFDNFLKKKQDKKNKISERKKLWKNIEPYLQKGTLKDNAPQDIKKDFAEYKYLIKNK